MTTTLNGTLLINSFNITTTGFTVTKAEIILDNTIDLLNTYDAGISALTGVAGSKTGTYTSKQIGAIMTLAREKYAREYVNAKDVSSANLGSLGSSHNTQNNMNNLAKALAYELTKGMDFDRV